MIAFQVLCELAPVSSLPHTTPLPNSIESAHINSPPTPSLPVCGLPPLIFRDFPHLTLPQHMLSKLPSFPRQGHVMDHSWFSCYCSGHHSLHILFWLPYCASPTVLRGLPLSPSSPIFSLVSQTSHRGQGPRCSSPA